MREIKFRVFEKERKRFGYISLDGNLLSWVSPTFAKQHLVTEINTDYVQGVRFENIEEAQQYTGLKDKDGTEVYDGDILECQDMHDSNIDYWGGETWQTGETKKPRYTVKWDEYRARFDYPYDIGYWKVIGNIYQPPTGA